MTWEKAPNPAQIVVQLKGRLAELHNDLTALQQCLEGGVNTPFKGDVKAAHLAAHKRGLPPKVEADPEVKAFIIARLDRLTFTDIVTELKQAFPPERHVSRSSLHRWWQKTGRFLPPKEAHNNALQSAIISSNQLIP